MAAIVDDLPEEEGPKKERLKHYRMGLGLLPTIDEQAQQIASPAPPPPEPPATPAKEAPSYNSRWIIDQNKIDFLARQWSLSKESISYEEAAATSSWDIPASSPNQTPVPKPSLMESTKANLKNVARSVRDTGKSTLKKVVGVVDSIDDYFHGRKPIPEGLTVQQQFDHITQEFLNDSQAPLHPPKTPKPHPPKTPHPALTQR